MPMLEKRTPEKRYEWLSWNASFRLSLGRVEVEELVLVCADVVEESTMQLFDRNPELCDGCVE
eukprot:CAMPEP_0171621226 /NCGR_PEP_ID=MMETSP0990-20121206/16482_1 /TAXON_ID=483369 /ORGANISM="non described non described, Strain CCMP2098" /LENGTH=62 /DNA_ID=CAMNT_0012186713 /DNA_START=199 /DNA_END=387 /DNA_ORIENTATION=-